MMDTIKRILIMIYLSFLVIFALNAPSSATTKAWLISDTKAVKLNTETNTAEKEVALGFKLGEFFIDAKKERLFNLHQVRRYASEIGIIDIKSLRGIGKIDLSINTDMQDQVQILFSPIENIFYLRWVKEEGGVPEIIAYDSLSLTIRDRYKTSPATSNRLMLSTDGNLLYSLDQDSLKVDLFKINDFSYISSVDIKGKFTLGSEGGFSDYGKDKILVSEVITRNPQLEYFDYIFDISTNMISQKIRTAIKGTDLLIPITKKIAIHEQQYIGKYKSMRLETDYRSSGKIHIFDVTTGKEVGLVKINVMDDGKFLGMTPAENKLYFLSYSSRFSNPMLHVIDLSKYSVIKTLPLPEASKSMVFFEE